MRDRPLIEATTAGHLHVLVLAAVCWRCSIFPFMKKQFLDKSDVQNRRHVLSASWRGVVVVIFGEPGLAACLQHAPIMRIEGGPALLILPLIVMIAGHLCYYAYMIRQAAG